MQGFWSRAGGGANVTRPQALVGQRAGYATGGSLYMRAGARNANVVNLQLPSIRAGCGGIDIFTGAFSFLSAEELIAMSKAIAASAAGFAFQLALESISPSVAETMGNLRDLAQKVNATSINSCETAASLVGGIWPKMERQSELICNTIGNSSGLFQDWAKGKHDCGNGGKENTTIAAGDDEFKDQIAYDVNYAWRAARKNSFLGTDNTLAEIFMSMSGTIIVRKGSNDKITRVVKEAKSYSVETLRAFVEGGSMRVYKCDEFTNCLNPTNGTVTISPGNAFFAYVRTIISDMYEAIRDEASLPSQAPALLNLTSLPVYQTLVAAHAQRQHLAESEVNAMAEAVALDVAYRYISEMAEAVSNGAGNLDIGGDDLGTFQENVKSNLAAMAELRREGHESFQTALAGLERLQLIRSVLAANGAHIFVSQMVARP